MTAEKTESGFKGVILILKEQIAKSRNWVIAFVMLLSYVALVTLSSQLASIAFQQNDHFKAPFLFVFFKILFRTLAFPVWLMVNSLLKLCQGQRVVLVDTWRHCEDICGEGGICTWRVLLFKFGPSAMTMLLMQIGCVLGLTYLSTSINTALCCSAVAISYGLTWVFFKRPLVFVKSLFVLVSFAGVILIAYSNFTNKIDLTKTIIGIVASLISALFLTLHQISFMKAFPNGDLGQVSFALTGMNILICLIYWPVPLAMYLTGYEIYDITEMPAGLVVASWICTGISSTTAGYGLVLSSPFFMSIGELLILAANSGLDVTIRRLAMSRNQLAGTVLIGIAFLVLVVPDKYLSITCCNSASDNDGELEDAPETEVQVQPAVECGTGRIVAYPNLQKPSSCIRKLLVYCRLWSSIIRSVPGRTRCLTGEIVDAGGKQVSYEFCPSSEPYMVLSMREYALPMGLPESRIPVGDGAPRMSVKVRRMTMTAGRRPKMSARRISRISSMPEGAEKKQKMKDLETGPLKPKPTGSQLPSLDDLRVE